MSFIKYLVLITGIVLCNLAGIQTSSAQTNIETRIVGGTESASSDWPWMVALSFAPNTSAADARCGGTLIDENWVLTAAHCVHDELDNVISPSILVSYVGAYDLLNTTGTSRTVTKIVVHPKYNPDTADNDIALLELSSPVTTITPLKLINSSAATDLENSVDDGVNDLSAIGWGKLNSSDSNYPAILRDVGLPYVSNNVCNTSQVGGQVTDNMMCAGTPAGGVDTCQGDSGGPLVFYSDAQWHQAGIVSWGLGCAQANSYGVYTRVNNYTQWVDLILKGYLVTPEVEFGSWLPGLVTTAKVTIDNFNGSALGVSVSVANEAYTIVNDDCTPSINIGAACDVTIKFTAGASTGDVAGALLINTDIPSIPVISIPLQSKVVAERMFSHISSLIRWATDGYTGWDEVMVTSDGGYSLQSGDVVNTKKSSLFAYVTVDASGSQNVYFDWKVCSEPDWDFLELWVDNVKVDAVSGDMDWASRSITLTGAGDHVIEWRYNKDYLATYGADAGWLDNVELDVSMNPVPIHNQSCNLVRQAEEPAPEIVPPAGSSGGGATSPWLYLGLGIPLMMRRRLRMH